MDKSSRTDLLLDVQNLVVTTTQGNRVVDGVSFQVGAGETVALVGESGSGKSLTARSIAALLPPGLRASGSIRLQSIDVIAAKERTRRRLRGTQVALLLQDPFTSLNPLATIQRTMAETASASGADLREVIAARIAEVGMDPGQAMGKYPWELSGGMRQRISLAAALSGHPLLLLADEPTTALDATTQQDVLRLIHDLQVGRDMGMLLITHDLRVAMSMSDRVLVMSNGRIVEESTPECLRDGGSDPYTRKLWAAELPADRRIANLRVESRLADSSETSVPPRQPLQAPSMMVVRNLHKEFAKRNRRSDPAVVALRGVSFELREGRSLGIIGESGSGKTTIARCLLGLESPTSGEIALRDVGQHEDRPRKRLQCVFQDPYSSLNPMHSIGFTLGDAIRHRRDGTPRAAWPAEIEAALEGVDLGRELALRRPESLSGGQRQRVAIARALLLRPDILICDEPVAALDSTVQSQVLQVLRDAQDRGLTMVFITHDVSVARQMTDDLIVLHKGEVVESGETSRVLDDPRDAYTKRLLSSVPTGDKKWLAENETATAKRPVKRKEITDDGADVGGQGGFARRLRALRSTIR